MSNNGGIQSGLITPFSHAVTFTIRANAYVSSSQIFGVKLPSSLIVKEILASVDTAPVGASLNFNIYTTNILFTTISLSIPSGSNYVEYTPPSTLLLNKFDKIRVGITQVGSTTPGGNDMFITLIFGQ